jgi:predicted transcriptional regulator
MKGWHQLSPKTKECIIRLSRRKPPMPQKQIAVLTGVHRNSVYRTQREFGLRARPQRPSTAAILDLLRRGVSRYRTAKALGTTESVVRYIAENNNLKPGHHPRPFTAEQAHGIMQDIFSGLYSGVAISKRTKTDYKKTMRIIHEVRACSRFLGGITPIPLDSYFPQKWTENKLSKADAESRVLFLCDVILRMAFGGQMPAKLEQFVEVGVEIVCAYFRKEAPSVRLSDETWEKVRKALAAQLKNSVTTLASARSGTVN